MQDIDAFLRNLTTLPGVYMMLDAHGKVIYVGKAKNLKKRVTSYFKRQLDNKTINLVRQISNIQVTITRNEREALLLESSLIKQLNPRYNVVFKDDKSFPYLFLSTHEEFPRLSFHRGARSAPGKYYGPYPSATEARDALNLLQTIFKLRQCDNFFFKSRTRPCLQYQIKRCTAPCVGYIDAEHYQQDVQNTILFFEGKSDDIVEQLISKMEEASKNLDYERAARIRDQIALLRKIQGQQIIVGEKINVDVLGVYLERGLACIHLLVIREGRMLGSRHYFPKSMPQLVKDTGSLEEIEVSGESKESEESVESEESKESKESDETNKTKKTEETDESAQDIKEFDEEISKEQEIVESFITQHYLRDFNIEMNIEMNLEMDLPKVINNLEVEGEAGITDEIEQNMPGKQKKIEHHRPPSHEFPTEIIVPNLPADQKILEDILTEHARRRVEIKKPTRGRALKWLEMAIKSAEKALKSRLITPTNLASRFEALQDALNLPAIPERIECFDVSHTMGESTVASCVVFDINGPAKDSYRRFNIKGVIPGDDYAAMKQALTRHYTRLKEEGKTLPDVLLIDGGKGQLAQAVAVLHELQVTGVIILGVAKGPERRPGLETLYRPNGEILELAPDSRALHLIQQVRDEAHRFAISLHRKQSRKSRMHSRLEDIPGVGKSRRLALLRRFGGLQEVKQATVEELAKVQGINQTLAERIYQALHGES